MFGGLVKRVLELIGNPNGTGENGTGTGGTGASSQSATEKFLPNAGGPLALPFGLHIVAGQLAYDKYFPGSEGLLEPSHRFAIWNGEGLGIGWEAPVRVAWAGKLLELSPDGNTPGYHWHPGTYSASLSDVENGGIQGQDTFCLNPLPFSGTCYTAVLLPSNLSVEAQPDKLRGVYKCMRMPIFNESGVWTDKGTATQYKYSTNPADVCAFGVWRSGLLHRMHWPSWWRFRQYCNDLITWDNGTEELQIKRFEAHPVWAKAVGLAEVLDTIGLITGMTWQDDGRLIKFLLPNDLTPQHVFTSANIAPNSFRAIDTDLRQRLNRLIIRSRDIHDEWLKPFSVPTERELLWTLHGEHRQEIALPNMTHSQAQRVGEMIMRVATDNPDRASFEAYGDSFHLLEGDCATATFAENGWTDQLVRINSVIDISALSRPDARRFEVQAIDGELYRDADHKPIQAEVEPE